jgi:hypothetical protein
MNNKLNYYFIKTEKFKEFSNEKKLIDEKKKFNLE